MESIKYEGVTLKSCEGKSVDAIDSFYFACIRSKILLQGIRRLADCGSIQVQLKLYEEIIDTRTSAIVDASTGFSYLLVPVDDDHENFSAHMIPLALWNSTGRQLAVASNAWHVGWIDFD